MVPYKPEARSGSEPTVEFVYTIRGYALLWVVLDHAVAFTEGSFGYVVGPGNRSLYNVVDDITEGTRLPILMFLAALFVERGFNSDARSFITKRIKYLVWPWLLWTFTTIMVLATANKLGNELSTTQFDELLSMWWKPQYQTWFLYDLIVYNVVYLAVRTVDRRLVLAVAVALFAASFWLGDMQMSSLVGKGIRHYGRFFLFYWLGIMLSRWVLSCRVEQERLLLACCLAAFLLLAVPPVLMDVERWHTTAIASALPALPLMLWLGPRLAATPLRAPLGWVGRASLLILCLHLIPAWALVVGARRLGIDDPTLVALLSATGTIAFCYGVDRLTQSTGLSPSWALLYGPNARRFGRRGHRQRRAIVNAREVRPTWAVGWARPGSTTPREVPAPPRVVFPVRHFLVSWSTRRRSKGRRTRQRDISWAKLPARNRHRLQ